MGQVNCNAAQSKVRCGRVIYGKEGLKFIENIRRQILLINSKVFAHGPERFKYI